MEMSGEANVERSTEIKPKAHFTGKVVKIGLAGAVVEIGDGKQAVIHVSQIMPPDGQPIKRVEDVFQLGSAVDVWVRKVKDERVELTMFKPLDLEWREIKKGMVVKGKVVRLEKFGAFVEIGAERPGLIHISEMSHSYVHAPSDVVKEGDEVEAQVLEVNRRKKQIKLSLKALQALPEPEPEPEVVATSEGVPSVESYRMESTKAKEKPRRAKKTNRKKSDEGDGAGDFLVDLEEPEESETDTSLGIALREAMEKAKTRKKQLEEKNKKNKPVSQEQEDLLARTLGRRSQNA